MTSTRSHRSHSSIYESGSGHGLCRIPGLQAHILINPYFNRFFALEIRCSYNLRKSFKSLDMYYFNLIIDSMLSDASLLRGLHKYGICVSELLRALKERASAVAPSRKQKVERPHGGIPKCHWTNANNYGLLYQSWESS
jgi:hypothetical protein